MDTKQDIENSQQVDELRLKNAELKKELEREQLLHKLLFKDWEKLTEQMAEKNQEVYGNTGPKNLFYKYAFYGLLVALVPAFYFLYPRTDKQVISPQVVSDTMHREDSAAPRVAAAAVTDSLTGRDPVSIVQKKPLTNQVVTPPPAAAHPLPPEQKKANTQDSSRPAPSIRKYVVETPLTDDARDSISSLGFSAYFNHGRNPFRRSSEKYKLWAKGWNDGKAEGKKLVEKDPSLKH